MSRPLAVSETSIQIPKDNGVIEIRPRRGTEEGFEIILHPQRADLYVPRASCYTTLPLDLLQYWADRSDFAWFCDLISRHEDQTTIPEMVQRQLFAYFPPEHFEGKRLLDFGCGTGASTFAIARVLPKTEVVGVELDADRIDIANRIKAALGLSNIQFHVSPSPNELPPETRDFDFVMLSAVYEHLLPGERRTLMPLLWSAIRSGGVLFLSDTPYRYSPLEAHSTGLWFVNYLPDSLAHWTVRHFAGRNLTINRSKDWNVHLRGGLRGGTEKAVVRDLTGGDRRAARILQPHQNGLRDRADLWLSRTSPRRFRSLKRGIAQFFRLTDRVFGTVPALNLEVAIQKLQ